MSTYFVGHRKVKNGVFQFTVWAPRVERLQLEILDPEPRLLGMTPAGGGMWRAEADGLAHGQRYRYVLNGETRRPDPAGQWQPEGVHGPSAVVDHDAYAWRHPDFRPAPLNEVVLYELHIGTFSPQGTFAGAVDKLDYLAELGVNAVEVMPVNPFPGERNWGYDGVQPFGVQHSYGGPDGFKALVDACHARDIAVILDVVHNHLGPEGNYTRDFAPYFTDRYHTPWGEAINFDGPGSDNVRDYFIGSALLWLDVYRVDGLRMDAIHAIYDMRPRHYLAELALAVEDFADAAGRRIHLIAESHLNDPRLTAPVSHGGHGMHTVWNDDLHHAAHTLLTGESKGYYQDYGRLEQLAETLEHGFCYQGQFSPYRGHGHGLPLGDQPATAVTNWLQTHDQVGNRATGERLSSLVDPAALRLGAVLLFTAPGVPMLFMGEEWGETNPFLYFVSHGDKDLVEAVRQGRKAEFKKFDWAQEPPDPQAVDSFTASLLDWDKPGQPGHKGLLDLHRELIRLRRTLPGLQGSERRLTRVWPMDAEQTLAMERRAPSEGWDGPRTLCLFNFGGTQAKLHPGRFGRTNDYRKVLDTTEVRFGGTGPGLPSSLEPELILPPYCAALYGAG